MISITLTNISLLSPLTNYSTKKRRDSPLDHAAGLDVYFRPEDGTIHLVKCDGTDIGIENMAESEKSNTSEGGSGTGWSAEVIVHSLPTESTNAAAVYVFKRLS